ncbi:MAG: hypothetical protein ACJ8FT_10725 [Sphingomonas sp.]
MAAVFRRWTAVAIGPLERDTRWSEPVFRAIAALALASASAHSAATLTSTGPWWERVTVLVTDDGEPQSCHYESSFQPAGGKDCSVVKSQAAAASSAGAKDQFTRITFERRFSPGAKPDAEPLQAGETLLGGRVMALAIDANGAVKDCQIVATSGSVAPQYGCDELAGERFEASVGGVHNRAAAAREGYMSVLVYGHSEHVV